jgi:adenylosuccinate synthase
MSCTIVAGGQWGDEAKGKICSYLAMTDQPAIACRAGLGPGAGHTVVFEGKTHKVRQTPSAFINRRTRLLLGAGVLINPAVLLQEVAALGLEDRIGIDPRASIIDPHHVEADRSDHHLSKTIASTGSGHGPCLAARAMRTARLAGEEPSLRPFLADVPAELNEALDRGKNVQVEGTNGYLLSVLYGTYPHTVGKDSTASTIAADVGLGPLRVTEVILTFKTFPTRVGTGPFATEMPKDEVQARGFIEFGTVTNRPRRLGHFDFGLAREAARMNHPSDIAATFMDRIDPECRGKTYGELSTGARDFLSRVEQACKTRVTFIGTGPDTFDIIDRRGMA